MPPAGDITARGLNRALLARQLLLARSPLTPLQAVEHLVGLQSQLPQPPYTGLWSRLASFDPAALSALLADRSVVRVALQRSTIHLVAATDAPWLRTLLQPVLDRGLRASHGARLAGVDLDALATATRTALADGPRTFAELGAHLQQRWPAADVEALGAAARTAVPLVQVPPRGLWRTPGPAAHLPLDAWVAPQEPRDLDHLLRRYLAAYGPATVLDAQKWCGLTRLGEVATRLRPGLVVLRGPDGQELLDLPDAPRPDPGTPAPVRFLPEWDDLLLSHADRTRVLDAADRPAVFTANGLVRATVLVDGRVRATWTTTRTRDAAAVHVTPLRPLAPRVRAAVRAEGARLLRFSEPGADHVEVHLG